MRNYSGEHNPNHRHGHTAHGVQSPTYYSWWSMTQRCANPRHAKFSHYGAKGIEVCDRWRVFSNFLADMGERPPGHTIDRKDSKGNYSPGNCQWATQSTQMRNTSRTLWVNIGGVHRRLIDYCEETGLNIGLVRQRLKRGKTLAEALKPARAWQWRHKPQRRGSNGCQGISLSEEGTNS